MLVLNNTGDLHGQQPPSYRLLITGKLALPFLFQSRGRLSNSCQGMAVPLGSGDGEEEEEDRGMGGTVTHPLLSTAF